jgi:CRP-like cAMP-binding protein
MTAEQRIAHRYKQFGVDEALVNMIVQSGIDHGLTRKASLIGARMCLIEQFKQHEYFTAEDIAEVTGESVETVNHTIEERKDELLQSGGMVEVRPAPGFGHLFS